ncbi:hypothetical protein HAX54_037413 [Datura stramonium]|uniref:Uncharacterized protein n=1 Tax=Datura stramonium TaxID=4076 RepID=A0ABS8SH46_DATST|nr:hypothetical protein [Datura stramonium]
MATRVSANSASARSNITKWRSYASTAEHPDAVSAIGGFWGTDSDASAEAGTQCVCEEIKEGTIPEVTEPEEVVDDADKFIKKSFFRKVAHVQDFDNQSVMPDPIRGDVLAREPHSETLKSVGVNPTVIK